ncbi:MAG: Uma2 family endonuclease [Gemmataceae bacterium]
MIKKIAKAPQLSSRPGVHTFDDFCWMVGDGRKADLINGTIYMASPENTNADALYGWLHALMNFYINKEKLGRLFGSRVAFKLDEYNSPEPDIAFLLDKHKSRIRRGRVQGPPDLAVEIVSPDSVERDYGKKRLLYEVAGVQEYWIIDEFERKVLLLRLDGRGKYREIRPRNGVLQSQVIKGFWIKPSWFWQQPLPDLLETLEQIESPSAS